jgi:hypothetical protein
MRPDFDLPAEKNDPLWTLLGQAGTPEPDPWFTGRTLALCREARAKARRTRTLVRWLLGAGVGASLAVGLITVRPSEPAVPQQKVQEAFEVIASMDDSDSSAWQDSSSL